MADKSVIVRAEPCNIERVAPPEKIRVDNEVASAYIQVGDTPNRNTKSWYRDIYEFYQNNEC